MIVDDSTFVRRAVRRMLAADPELDVVGEAADGPSALREVDRLAPDVVTLDLRMPGLDGVETLESMMETRPTPVVLLSSYAQADAALTLRALAAGAVDFVDKSRVSAMDVYRLAPELVAKLKAAAAARRRSHGPAGWLAPPPSVPPRLVVLGASTGGPKAIEAVLAALPAASRFAVLVVQHLPAGFTAAFARRLAGACALPVDEVVAGRPLRPGTVAVVPGGSDASFDADGAVQIAPGTGRALPRIDVTLASAAACYGAAACAVILTGMGRDGVDGARRIRAAGGAVVAEAASTCAVYGMPRAIVDEGLATCVAPIDEIAAVIGRLAALPGGAP